MKKRDYVVLGVIAGLVIIWFIAWKLFYSTPGMHYYILCNNIEIYSGNLDEAKCIVIDNGNAIEVKDSEAAYEYMDMHTQASNIIVIDDGHADVIAADCPDKICVNTNPVSEIGNSIVCMPNRVVVSIRN